MRYHNEINLLERNVLGLKPGGVYNLNEDNETELRVVKLHLLKTFAERCDEDIAEMAENHVVMGAEIEALADKLFELYRPSIERGHDVFWHEDYFRPGRPEKYLQLFETFRATGKDVSNVANFNENYDGPGRVYLGTLYIASTELWPEELRKDKRWYLQISNQEWLSSNLEFLEYELFIFALREGYIEEEV